MYQIDNFYLRAVALLAAQFQGNGLNGGMTNFQKLLYAILTQATAIEAQLVLLNTMRNILTAQGVQLDGIGQILGLARIPGQSDDSYRQALIFQIFIDQISGSPEQVITVLKTLTQASKIWYIEVFPAAYQMATNGLVFPTNPSDLVGAIQSSSPAGVNFLAVTATYDTLPFSFSGDVILEPLYVAPNPDDIFQLNPFYVDPGTGGVQLYVNAGETENSAFGGGFAEAYYDFTVDTTGAGQLTRSYNDKRKYSTPILGDFMSVPIKKPTVFPVWADEDQNDDESKQNNVETPPPEKQQYGWARLEFPPRNWFNWLGRYTWRWLNWLNQQEAQATVVEANAGNLYTTTVYNFSNLPSQGALLTINVIDEGDASNFYSGIAYAPQTVVSAITINQIAASSLTVSTISTAGVVTIGGGTGPYIIWGQIKTIPS